MEEKNFILENEYDVNRIMLKMFKILLFMIPVIIVFKGLKLFIVPWNVVAIVSIAMIILSAIPIYFFKDVKNRSIKLYSVICFLVLSTVIYSFVFVNGIFFMIVPSLIALLYFDTKLLKISLFSTIPLMMVGELFASISEQKFLASMEWIPLHIVVFSMQFIIIFILLLNLANRAKKMLNDTKNMFMEISHLYKNIFSSSKEVSQDVSELYNNFYETTKFSKQVEEFISLISEKTEVFSSNIKDVVLDSKEVSEDIEEIYEVTSEMKNETKETGEQLGENLKNIIKIVEKFKNISTSTETSKISVNKLFDEIKEIHKAIELIEKIQKKTSLLSINASIEASRIGEAGRGFKVVADGIKQLAIQSNEYIDIIKKQLKLVEENSKETVGKIESTYTSVEEGMDSISTLEEFFEFIKNTLMNTRAKIDNLDEKMDKLEIKEKNINSKIIHISDSNSEIIDNIYNVTASIEELNATFDSNVILLKNIDDKSKSNSKKIENNHVDI